MTALTKRKAALIFAVTLAAILAVAAPILFLQRASVNYSMSGYAYMDRIWDYNRYAPFYSSTMPSTYYHMNNNTPLMVALHWTNTGKADASLQLVVSTENANITWISNFGSENITAPVWATEQDGQAFNGTKATFNVVTPGSSELQSKYVNIFPVGHPGNFTVTFQVKDNTDLLSTLMSNGATTATYRLIKDDTYELVN